MPAGDESKIIFYSVHADPTEAIAFLDNFKDKVSVELDVLFPFIAEVLHK